MRKSIVLMIILFAYIIGCSSSESDKYDLITKKDKKTIMEFCDCLKPMVTIISKMMNTSDSTMKLMYSDSLEAKAKEFDGCLNDIEKIEGKAENDKYFKQLIDYIAEKQPECAAFFLGKKNVFKEDKSK